MTRDSLGIAKAANLDPAGTDGAAELGVAVGAAVVLDQARKRM